MAVQVECRRGEEARAVRPSATFSLKTRSVRHRRHGNNGAVNMKRFFVQLVTRLSLSNHQYVLDKRRARNKIATDN